RTLWCRLSSLPSAWTESLRHMQFYASQLFSCVMVGPMIAPNAQLLPFLNELRKATIHHHLSQFRDDAIMVEVAVPGERWELEFLDDGTVEVEVFRSDGTIRDASALEALIRQHADR